MKSKFIGAVAAAAAIAFITAPVTSSLAQAKSAKVDCYNWNSCKAKDSCKGKGKVKKTTAKHCKKIGGTITPPADAAPAAAAPAAEAPKS